MEQEDNDLLLKYLCMALPYGVKIEITWWIVGEGTYMNTTLEPDHIDQLLNDEDGDTEIKPYLRSISSMTEEEEEEFDSFTDTMFRYGKDNNLCCLPLDAIQWLLKNHFDFMDLIPKKLAIEVNKTNNPYEINM